MDDGDDDDTDDDDTDDDTDDDHDDDDTDDDNDHKNDSYTAAGAAPGASVPCSFSQVPVTIFGFPDLFSQNFLNIDFRIPGIIIFLFRISIYDQ